jgi:hypothetical protein
MTVVYNKLSPYGKTKITNGYLDVMSFRDIPSEVDDQQYEILSLYMHRPDLLAHDIYGDSQLWWVFSVRNKEILKDPIYDFVPGQVIFLPKLTTIRKALGL